jgi:hypothetical protein
MCWGAVLRRASSSLTLTRAFTPICADDCVMIRSRFLSQSSGKSWTRFSGAKSTATAHVDATANNPERATTSPTTPPSLRYRFSGSAWARQGSASPLRALDPPGALPMPCNYRSDGTSGSIPGWLKNLRFVRVDSTGAESDRVTPAERARQESSENKRRTDMGRLFRTAEAGNGNMEGAGSH